MSRNEPLTTQEAMQSAMRKATAVVAVFTALICLFSLSAVGNTIKLVNELRNTQQDREVLHMAKQSKESIISNFGKLPNQLIEDEARIVVSYIADVSGPSAVRRLDAFRSHLDPKLLFNARAFLDAHAEKLERPTFALAYSPNPEMTTVRHLGDDVYVVRFTGLETRWAGGAFRSESGARLGIRSNPTDVFEQVVVDVYFRDGDPSPSNVFGLYVIGLEYPGWLSLYDLMPEPDEEIDGAYGKQWVDLHESMVQSGSGDLQ